MAEIKQLHGLPGIGANGENGSTGDKGTSILVGYIEDFFDSSVLTIDQFVRYASKKDSDGKTEYYEDKTGQYISEYYIYFVKESDSDGTGLVKLSKDSSTITIPTVFSSSKSEVGDIIYVIEKSSTRGVEVTKMLTVSSDLFGKTLSYVLSNAVVLESPTKIESFADSSYGRLLVSEKFSPIRYEGNEDDELKGKYSNNFISENDAADSVLTVNEYSEDAATLLESLMTPESSLNKIIDADGNFVLQTSSPIKAPRIYVSNGCISDIELNNYTRSEISQTNGYVSCLSESDFDAALYKLDIKKSRFFSIASSDEFSYGCLLISSSDNKVQDFCFGNADEGFVDMLAASAEGSNEFKAILYASSNSGITYFSKPSLVKTVKTWLPKFKKSVISEYSVEDGDSLYSDLVTSGDTDAVDFYIDPVTSESNSALKFQIASREGWTIDKISFNGNLVFDDAASLDDPTAFADSNYWLSIASTSGDKTSKQYVLKAKDNIPNASGTVSSSSEYLKLFSSSYTSETDSSAFTNTTAITQTRSALAAVVSKDSSGNYTKSFYKIMQPGFSDTRQKPEISLNADIYSNALENSNKRENGVLCNQLQCFVDVSISNFNYSTWGRMCSDAKIDLFFSLDHYNKDKSLNAGTAIYNSNLYIYDSSYLDCFKNNAFRYKIEYFTDSASNDMTDASLEALSSKSEFSTYATDENQKLLPKVSLDVDSSTYSSDWISFSSLDSLSVFFNLKDASVKDIPFAAESAASVHKMRFLFEFANPIPSEINLNIALSKAVVHYAIDGEEVYFPAVYYAEKTNTSGAYIDFTASTGNLKFVISPMYFTLDEASKESLVSLKYKPAQSQCIGSPDQNTLTFGLFDFSTMAKKAEAQTEYQKISTFFDYSSYFFKTKDFQDNIKYISVKADDAKSSSMLSALSGSNDFVSMVSLLSSDDAAAYGFETFADDDRTNKFDDRSYLSLVYNSNIFVPTKTASTKTLYFNGSQYDAYGYDQYDKNAPVFLKEEFTLQIRSDEELQAISSWNYAYENSEFYNKSFTVGGNTTVSGNGYLNLPASYDSSDDSSLSLASLVSGQDVSVFTTDYTDTIQETSVANTYIPLYGSYWRVPLWNAAWMVPTYKYDKINKSNYIIPYRLTDSYTAFLDLAVTRELLKGNSYDDIQASLGYVTASYKMTEVLKTFLDGDGKAIVTNAKYGNQYDTALLDTMLNTSYTYASLSDTDLDSLKEVMKSYSKTADYASLSDVPKEIARWWVVRQALVADYAVPYYDTNLSESQVLALDRSLLEAAMSEDDKTSSSKYFNLEAYEKYSKKEDGSYSRNSFIPYNLAYSIYPRTAYPSDKTKVNVLMLQNPTICSNTSSKMNVHYFSTLKYSDVYPDLPEPYSCLL